MNLPQSKRILAFVLLIIVISSRNAYAYIDPGSGSYFFQLLIAGLVGSLFAIKMYWRKLLSLFTRKQDKKEDGRKS